MTNMQYLCELGKTKRQCPFQASEASLHEQHASYGAGAGAALSAAASWALMRRPKSVGCCGEWWHTHALSQHTLHAHYSGHQVQ